MYLKKVPWNFTIKLIVMVSSYTRNLLISNLAKNEFIFADSSQLIQPI